MVHEGGWQVIASPTEGFVFRSPGGRSLNAAPPVIAGHPDAVAANNRSARDGRCRWGGETLDLDLALTALFSRRNHSALAGA